MENWDCFKAGLVAEIEASVETPERQAARKLVAFVDAAIETGVVLSHSELAPYRDAKALLSKGR